MPANKLSIAFNCSMLDEHPTGVGIYSVNLINSFSLLCGKDSAKQLTVFTPTKSFFSGNIKIIRIPSIVKSSQYGMLAAFSRFLWNVFVYHYKTKNYNLLISPTTHGSFFANNQVIAIHDLISLRYKNISTHQRFYFKHLLPFLVKKAKKIITVSENSKRDIAELLECTAEKIEVVYNGFDSSKFFYSNIHELQIEKFYGVKNYLLAVGPTYPHKNFETLIDGYVLLNKSIKNLHPLVIAGGKKKYINFLKNYIRQNAPTENILFTNYVADELMPSLYREATMLIFPSLYEGFGIPVLEAMACGCPVISSNASSLPEVCGDAALYFSPLNREDLMLLIERLIRNTDLQQELRNKGLLQAKKFSWEQSAKSLQTIINKLNP